jgi:gluconate 2-dehydrogenase gamma chain
MPVLSRRNFLIASATASAAACSRSAPNNLGPEYPEQTRADAPLYLNASERRFIAAACARIIPQDDLGPGAVEAGVPDFIDRQLAGPFGQATTWYMQGPWAKGSEQQGYQLKFTPAEMYRHAIRNVDDYCTKQHGKAFADLGADIQDTVLGELEKGSAELADVPAKTFFGILLQNVIEGFLADPMYGGNKDFIGWKLVGFPGPRYNYVDEIEQFGKPYPLPPVSLKLGRAKAEKA